MTSVLGAYRHPVGAVHVVARKFEQPLPEAIVLDEERKSFIAYVVAGTLRFVLVDGQGRIQEYKTGYRASQGLAFDSWGWGQSSVGFP
jgi:hypothetical protein